MKKINNSSFVMLLAAMLMVSTFWACTFGAEEIPQTTGTPGELVVNLRTSSGNKLHTRAALTTIVATNEAVVNNMVVGIFKSDGTQSKIEKYTTTDLGTNASADGLQQNVTTSYTSATQAVSKIELDDKVLVVINVPDDRLDDFTANTLTYATFKQLSLSTAEAITHTANGTEIADDALPMWGEGKVAANGATFKADVTVIRMVAKVTLASLTANFTESLHPNAKFKLTEVFLLNVPDATDLQYTWNATDNEYTYEFGKIADTGDDVTTYFTGQEKITDANGDEVDLATTPTDNFPAAAAAVQKHLAPYVGSGALTTVEPITTGSTAISGYTFYTLPNNSATYNTKLIIKGKYTDDETKDPVATKGHDAYYAINLYPDKTADVTNKNILPNTNYSVSAVIKGDGADDAYSAMPKMETIESTITTLAFDEYQNTVTFNGGITNEAQAPAKVGDLYYSDGTWGPYNAENAAKTPIGIVFSTNITSADYQAGYHHGYVMALKRANGGANVANWCTNTNGLQSILITRDAPTDFYALDDIRVDYEGLTYCNAAHNTPVLLTNDGTCRLLEAETNLPIGVEDHYHYEEQQIAFPEGSALLLYTDGLTEAVYKSNTGNRKLFGEERVLHDVEKNLTASASEIIDYLKQHVTIFADGTEQGDDLTLMFIRHGKSQNKDTSSSRRIIMKNEMAEVSRMRGFFFSVCREYGISDETAKMLNLAIEEWVANVINYAYPKGTRGHVEMTADVSPSRLLTVVIKDHGEPFDPTSQAEVDIDAELDDRTIGGLGIHMVRSIMDSMSYERTANGYNVLTLTKSLESKV